VVKDKRIFLFSTIFGCLAFFSQAESPVIDPTRPSLGAQQAVELVKTTTPKKKALTAIFFKNGIGKAIINNKLYQSGDTFAGNKVVSIKANSVLLKNTNGFQQLTLINKFKKLKK